MTSMLQDIFNLCVVPLLGVITTYIVKFIQKKSSEIDAKVDNDIIEKYNHLLSEVIKECVISTNQTYVEALKNQNAFDADAQKKAFEKTYNKVMSIITDSVKEQLTSVYGDFVIYLTTKIEAEVNLCKTEVKNEN